MNGLLALGVGSLAVAAVPYAAVLLAERVIGPAGSPARKDAYEPTVSVVVPTYDEARIVTQKLEDVFALDYPMEKVEVVVVDSSTDRTPELVREAFEDREAPSLRLVREDARGLAKALNTGYEAATNEIVVKTDCDSQLADDALRETVANFADPAVGGVTGTNAGVLGGSEVETDYRGLQGLVQTVESHIDSTFIFHGPISAYRNDAIVDVDRDSLADDTELALRVRKQGLRVVFDPAVRYAEAAHSSFTNRRSQKDRRAVGLLRLLWRQREVLGRYGRYGRVVVPLNWLMMVVSPWLTLLALLALTTGLWQVAPAATLAVPVALAAVLALGSRESLGPLQPGYALLDAQVSCLAATVQLARGPGDAVWEAESELRDHYETTND